MLIFLAQKIYDEKIKLLESCQIPLENVIGFSADGCNTMMGAHNSVSSRLRQKCPGRKRTSNNIKLNNFVIILYLLLGITIMKCICHSLHLCASESCKNLPRKCEALAHDIYNFFKNFFKWSRTKF